MPGSGAAKPTGKPQTVQAPSLIQRFQLESKVSADGSPGDEASAWDGTGPIPSSAKGKGRAGTIAPVPTPGGAVWEATPEKRHESLQKRKEAMILAARQYVCSQIHDTMTQRIAGVCWRRRQLPRPPLNDIECRAASVSVESRIHCALITSIASI